MAKSEILKPFILSWEGGFVNDPNDKGGATHKGVTLTTFKEVFGKTKTTTDLKKMTDEQWLYIFKKYYWDRWSADNIQSQSVANILVDWVWLSGTYGIRNVQKILGVKVDGIVGPVTISAINNFTQGQHILFDKIKVARAAFINSIAVGAQAKFKKGWVNRLSGIQYDKLVCNNGTIIKL